MQSSICYFTDCEMFFYESRTCAGQLFEKEVNKHFSCMLELAGASLPPLLGVGKYKNCTVPREQDFSVCMSISIKAL